MLLAVVYTAVSLTAFSGSFKVLIIIFCLAAAVILLMKTGGGKLGERFSFQVGAMAAYMLLVAVSAAWASAGKFFLREYSKLLFAFTIYLIVLLCLKRTRKAVNSFIVFLSAASALYAFLSVDMATVGFFRPLIYLIPDYSLIDTTFEAGTRLTGIFGSGNTLAGLLGLGILLNLYLLETVGDDGKKSRPSRILYSVLASFSAYSFLLSFSMGASGFFILAVVVYLILSGRKRGNVLLHMLFIAIPTFIFVFIAFGFFAAQGFMLAFPLICMLLNAAVCSLLELFLYPLLEKRLCKSTKAVNILMLAIVILIAGYGVSSLLVSGPYSLAAGSAFHRSAYPEAGKYTLNIDYSGDLNISVISQDSYDVMKHTETAIYSGAAEGAAFTVPEGSRVIYIAFNSGGGAEIRKAVLSGSNGKETSLKLNYLLLPDFISNRLQGFRANENMIQRTVFFADGMKLYKNSPVFGNGLGSFESLICGYQDFYYETKYVHNNYIQVLLDNGIIGFIAYAAILLGTLLLLIKGRKREGEFRLLWPALSSAFVMICFHSYMEVVMSTLVYLPFAFSVFALAALCYGGGGLKAIKKVPAAASRWASLAISVVYPVLIILNIYASSYVNSSLDSLPSFYKALSTAINIDCFEYNDYKLSAVTNYPAYRSPLYRGLVDKCAADLIETPSNSIHLGLIDYYMQMSQPDMAITAAIKGAKLNYSNPELWNQYFSVFYTYAAKENSENPFLGENGAVLVDGIKELYSLMLDYNKRLWEPIVLDSGAQALIDYVNSF